jgi:hypothetical protein
VNASPSEPTPISAYAPDLAEALADLPALDWWRNPRTGELVGTPPGEPEAALAAFTRWCVEREGGLYEQHIDAGYQTAFICRTVLGKHVASVRLIVPLTSREEGESLAQLVAREVERRLALG